MNIVSKIYQNQHLKTFKQNKVIKLVRLIIHDCFSLVWFYGTSTIVGYLMPNPFDTYILNIYDLLWLGFVAYQLVYII